MIELAELIAGKLSENFLETVDMVQISYYLYFGLAGEHE